MDFEKTKELMWAVLGDFRRALKPLIVYHLWFLLVYVAVLAPMIRGLLDGFLWLTGHALISNYDLIQFGLTPAGVAFFLLAGALHLALLYLEQAGLLVLAVKQLTSGRSSAISILRTTLPRFPALVRLGLWQLVGFGLLFLPFAAGLYVVHAVYLAGVDINFHLAENTLEWRRAKGIAATFVLMYLALAACLYLRWIFALAEVVFNGQEGRSALIRSWRLTRDRWSHYWLPLGGWWGVVGGVTFLAGWLVHSGTEAVLNWAGDRLGWVLPLLLAAGVLSLALGLISSILRSGVHQFQIARFFLTAEQGLHPERAGDVPRFQDAAILCWRWLRWVPPICLILVLGFFVYELNTLDLSIPTQVTAHRGSSHAAPENTLAAVRQAMKDGADYVEIDVQTTRDGRVVVLHDADLKRVAGDPRRVWDMTWEELQKLDVGAWFGPEFRGERVPLLSEVIELTRDRVRLNVELKYNRPDPLLARKTIAILRRENVIDQCLVTSLDQRAIEEVRRLAPDVRTGLILTTAMGRRQRAQADVLSVQARQVHAAWFSSAKRRGTEIHVWTINERQQMLRMLLLGVDNIITDEPAQLRALIEELEALSPPERLAVQLRNAVMPVPRTR